jgi:release factor glutamine methyltransferase
VPETPESTSLASVVARLRAAGCVFAEDEARLLVDTAETADELDAMVGRRVAGLPLEHVLGWAAFAGLRIAVEPGVFVPRRRTEFLVDSAVDPTGGGSRTPRIVVDMCCGSGAIGAAVAAAVPDIDLYAVDSDEAAVRCARRNLAGIGARVLLGNLFEPLPGNLRGRVDLILANAPYVPTREIALMPPEAREHEPLAALDGGPDGLDIQRRVIREAKEWLAPGGRLLMETSDRQAPRTAKAMAAGGLTVEVVTSEDLDATVVIGTRPGPRG